MSLAESQVESVFFAALEKQAPAERAAYLDGACSGNPALRQRVEQLLQAHPQVENFLHAESPAEASGLIPTFEQPVTERPGTVIGPYKLLEQIGEGGFGIVFMAEQTQPVRRKVALKVLKPGMDTRQVIARFEAERQALAVMDHPNIAKVLEAGETATGRPYFVMELVKGIPITGFCDQVRMPTRQRLELLISVCRAVQHAHQKGIIHRDLKPTNVLVTMADGAPIVKVIDFGIAKAAGQQLTEKTLFTGFGQMIGTPLYMSPEQAAFSAVDVDTRSDVYSLGVLLYELLTGSTPFDKDTLAKAGYDEMRRMIREDEPPRPSARLSTSSSRHTPCAEADGTRSVPATLASISALRQIEPAKLTKLLRGELDWIVMKALEKDRNRRYETANGLAADVQHYLSGEAVQACPPSAVYRFRKFTRKNKAAFTTAALVAAALIIGTVISLWQAREAVAARKLADHRLVQEERARQETEAERQRATANFKHAREAVKQMLTRVALVDVGAVPAMKEVRQKLLEDAATFYTELLNRNPNDAQTYFERAHVFLRLSKFDDALVDAEKAFELSPENPDYWNMIIRVEGGMRRGRKVEYIRQAVERYPDVLRFRLDYAHWLALGGQTDEARRQRDLFFERKADKSAEDCEDLSRISRLLGETESAIDLAKRSISLAPTSSGAHLVLGQALSSIGEFDAAQRSFDEAVRFDRKPLDPNSAYLYRDRAEHDMRCGNYEAAVTDYTVALERAPYLHYLYPRRAKAHFFLGHYPEALADLQRNPVSALDSIPLSAVAACPNEQFRDGVMQLIDQAIERNPESNARVTRAALLVCLGRFDEAIASYRKAIRLNPNSAGVHNIVAWMLATCADRKFRDATEAVELATKAVELQPQNASYLNTLGVAQYRAANWPAAIEALTKSEELAPNKHTSFNGFFLAMAHWQLGEKSEARKWYDEAVAWMEKNKPEDEELRRFRAEAEELMGLKE